MVDKTDNPREEADDIIYRQHQEDLEAGNIKVDPTADKEADDTPPDVADDDDEQQSMGRN